MTAKTQARTGKTYTINKGINKSIEFKGLKAQYIWHLGGAVVGVLILFAILYISGISPYLCLPVTLGLGAFLIMRIYAMSRKYGQHGLMKKRAAQGVSRKMRSFSRRKFLRLKR